MPSYAQKLFSWRCPSCPPSREDGPLTEHGPLTGAEHSGASKKNMPSGLPGKYPILGDGFGYVCFQPLLGDDWTL